MNTLFYLVGFVKLR